MSSILKVAVSAAPVAVLLILLGAPSAMAHPAVYYKVVVSGGSDINAKARLNLFYQSLLQELHVKDLGYANIGCDNCGQLSGPAPVANLVFALEREGQLLPAFVVSYHHTQMNSPSNTFTLTVSGDSPPAGACPNPVPTGCRSRPICIQTSACDKPYGGACQACVP